MWIKDSEFIRGQVPMTKFNVRSLIIAQLAIEPGDNLLDIGCGTGSISVEAASHGANVFAIDKSEEACKLTRENSKKHGVLVEVVEGKAPLDLPDLDLDKCFIGGSTGQLENIFDYLEKNLKSKGSLVASFIMMKNAYEFKELLKKNDYQNIEVNLIQIAMEDKIGLMRGENPIIIIKGVKR